MRHGGRRRVCLRALDPGRHRMQLRHVRRREAQPARDRGSSPALGPRAVLLVRGTTRGAEGEPASDRSRHGRIPIDRSRAGLSSSRADRGQLRVSTAEGRHQGVSVRRSRPERKADLSGLQVKAASKPRRERHRAERRGDSVSALSGSPRPALPFGISPRSLNLRSCRHDRRRVRGVSTTSRGPFASQGLDGRSSVSRVRAGQRRLTGHVGMKDTGGFPQVS